MLWFMSAIIFSSCQSIVARSLVEAINNKMWDSWLRWFEYVKKWLLNISIKQVDEIEEIYRKRERDQKQLVWKSLNMR